MFFTLCLMSFGTSRKGEKNTVKFQLEGSDIERSLVVIEKHEKTAKKYPRKAGMPSREPLA